jgi:MFS family permease
VSSPFRSFHVYNYRVWFAGSTVSNIGTWMQRIGQDWIVLTMLTHQDAAAVGVTSALQFGPQLLLTPITGLVADRFDRRKVLIVTQGTMGALALGLGLLTVTGTVQLWMVYVFALLLGCASSFDAPVRQTFVSSLVPPSLLPNAVGLNATSFNTARLIGPAIAGFLVAAIGSGWVFLLNAVTFGATLGALFLFRKAELVVQNRPPRARGQVREGLRYVAHRSDLVLLFVMVFIMGTIGVNFPIYSSTMASLAFHQGASEFGLLNSAFAVGSIVGALIAARRERVRLRTVAIAGAGFGFSMIAAACMPTFWSFALVLPLVGISSITMMNNANAYVQTTTDPALRGRVMSLYMAIFVGGTPIGAPLIGAIVNTFGPRWGVTVGAFGGLIPAAIAAVWWLWHRRSRTAPELIPIPASEEPTPAEARLELATTEIAVVETEISKT